MIIISSRLNTLSAAELLAVPSSQLNCLPHYSYSDDYAFMLKRIIDFSPPLSADAATSSYS